MMNNINIVAFIFARGGSKGLPDKNIRPLNGKPLIAYSIELAKQIPLVKDVVVSTDSSEIAKTAEKYGALVPFMRPSELSSDNAPEMLAWRHALEYYQQNIGKVDVFVSLPAVSPLRTVEDVTKAISKLIETEADFVFTVKKSESNPYFNLVEQDGAFVKKSKDIGNAYRRQDVKNVYQIVPMVYAAKPESIFKYDSMFDGKVSAVEVPVRRAVDVDTIEDFEYLEYLSSKGNMNV